MKVCLLEGPVLDYWIARARGLSHTRPPGVATPAGFVSPWATVAWKAYWPSIDWAEAGPIMEKENIAWTPAAGGYAAVKWFYSTPCRSWVRGKEQHSEKSPLIAAMRCFVASKFGEEVPELAVTAVVKDETPRPWPTLLPSYGKPGAVLAAAER